MGRQQHAGRQSRRPLALALLAVVLVLPTQGHAFEPYAVKAYRPAGAIADIAQTVDGYIWFATHDGLFRFDGEQFVRFSQANTAALPQDHVYSLLGARDGSLWIGFGGAGQTSSSWEHGGGGVVRLEKGTFKRLTIDDGFADDWASTFAETSDGSIWVGTASGLSRWRNGTVTNIDDADGFPRVAVRSLHTARDGSLWVGSAAGVYRQRPGQRFAPLGLPDTIVDFTETADGTIWMTNLRELIRLDPASAHAPRRYDHTSGLPLDDIRSVAATSEGELWLGGIGGLFLLTKPDAMTRQSFRAYGRDRGVPDSFVTRLMSDREGAIWVGLRAGGVARVAKPAVWNFGSREGLAGDVGFAVLPSGDGGLWVSAAHGVSRFRDGQFSNYGYGDVIQRHMARSLAEDRQGRLLMSAEEEGITRFDGQRLETFAVAAGDGRGGLPGTPYSLIVDRDGHLWVSWLGGGVSVYRDADLSGPPITFGVGEGACPGRLWALAVRRSGGIWMGGDAGAVGHATAAGAACDVPGSGARGRDVMGLVEDAAGDVWIGGLATPGLTRLRAGVLRPFSLGITQTAHGVADDGGGHLWFGTRIGAYRVAIADLAAHEADPERRIDWLAVTHADGLRSDESLAGMFPLAAVDREGRFWFPTLLGVSAVAPPESWPAVAAPIPLVESVSTAEGEWNPHAPMAIPPGDRNLQIAFTAPWFSPPQQLVFEHRLTGYDTEWIRAGTRRSTRYTNLPPGRYAFSVRVRRGNQPWVELANPLTITLAPRFHETPAFLVMLAIILVGAIVALHRARVVRIEGRHQAVLRERARLARELHDNLGQGFTSLGYHLDALRLNDDPEKASSIVERARALLGHCSSEVRRLIWDLRSEKSSPPPLAQLLAEVIERVRVDGGPTITFQQDGQEDGGSALVRQELPLLVQEALGNAVRHARARRIEVSLATHPAGWQIEIADDGIGIETAAKTIARVGGGFGIVGMHERANRMQAALRIEGIAGKGTTVSVNVPREPPPATT